jgi:ATP-dependent 26S proteasome regulatory subunit
MGLIANDVIKQNGVVFFNPSPDDLIRAYRVINEVEPNRLIMVVFEEFDELLNRYESELLHVLDGEIQRNNAVYIATTNNIEKIPSRLLRPGRFSSTIEIKYPNAKARSQYLKIKMPKIDEELLDKWIKSSEGLSIDELKETVLAVECLDQDLDSVVKKIKKLKQNSEYHAQVDKFDVETLDEDY